MDGYVHYSELSETSQHTWLRITNFTTFVQFLTISVIRLWHHRYISWVSCDNDWRHSRISMISDTYASDLTHFMDFYLEKFLRNFISVLANVIKLSLYLTASQRFLMFGWVESRILPSLSLYCHSIPTLPVDEDMTWQELGAQTEVALVDSYWSTKWFHQHFQQIANFVSSRPTAQTIFYPPKIDVFKSSMRLTHDVLEEFRDF